MKTWKSITSLPIMIFGIAVLSAQLTYAEPAEVGMSIEDACGIPDGNGQLVITDSFKVLTNSENNNITLICHANIDNPIEKAIIDSEFLCRVADFNGNLFYTTDSHRVISASGEATLVCQFKD